LKDITNIIIASVYLTLIFYLINTEDKSNPIFTNKIESTKTTDLIKAKSENNKIIIVFGAKWCFWCKKLEQETLQNSKVKENISSKSIKLIFIDIDEEPNLALKNKVKSIPCIILQDDDKEEKRHIGYMGFREFISWIN